MTRFSRREFIAGASAVSAGAVLSGRQAFGQSEEAEEKETPEDVPSPDYQIQNGRINQSVEAWCYDDTSNEELIQACVDMGMPAIEGIDWEVHDKAVSAGLDISIVRSHPFKKGPVRKKNHDMVKSKLKKAIDVADEYDSPNVFTFTGYADEDMPREEGARNCVECWKDVMSYAEEKEVNVCLEHLNTRGKPPMRGHPGYFGDDVDFCVDMINRVGSERMKLIFDVYLVQIMIGDLIRRIEEYQDVIGLFHTAGVPGRKELDDTQEVNYKPVMETILDTGYDGYVAQEFIPTWDDELAALRHAVQVCDV